MKTSIHSLTFYDQEMLDKIEDWELEYFTEYSFCAKELKRRKKERKKQKLCECCGQVKDKGNEL